ncbi:MAG: TonB-dependent receptor [Bryobacteraceae bacterium]|nr:TonB-dependent receptor [Bryobacteraceae bacterium]
MRIQRFVFVAAMLTAPVFGQVATATLSGVVEDASGALIPRASVTALHVATADSRQAATNERGEFLFPFAKIGEYSLIVEAPGFSKKTLTGIVLRVDQTASIRMALEVGSVAESVEVTSAAPLVESSTTSLGQVIENRKIRELPLNGRNAFALGLLAGNTVPISGMGTNMPFAAGGGRFAHNDVLLDGIDNNTVHNNGNIGRNGIAYTPSVDAVEEFKVKTNNFSAEFGRSAGAIVSATIKSGTNQFRGSAWEFLRNEKLDANNFFSNANGVARQSFKQNQFGFTLGGPVYIPKLYDGRNRTFIFGDYDATRRSTSASSSLLDIAPMAFRTGDFSKYNRVIFDPDSRRSGPAGAVISSPFAGNVIPSSKINKSSSALLELLPAPNAGAPGADARNFLRIAPRGFDNDQFDIKVDHRLTNSNTLSGRFSKGKASTPNPGNLDGFIGDGSDTVAAPYSLAVTDTHMISPTTVNEARFGYVYRDNSVYGRGLQEGVDFAKQNNIAMLDFPVITAPAFQFSWTGIQASSNQFVGLGGGGGNNFNYERTYHIADNLSLQRGAHGFKVGGEVRRYGYDRLTGGGSTNYFGPFFSSSSDAVNSGAPFADFLFGFQSVVQGGQLIDWARQRDIYTGFYAQDDWKVNSRLTLNLGIRYELYTQPVDANDVGGYFNRALARVVTPGSAGFSRAIVNGDHNNFAPRVGIAWAASRKFTVRMGGGMFYARRDQNPEVTMMGTNLPNSPVILFPATTASGTVKPLATINIKSQVAPSDPSLKEFTPQNPKPGGFRSPDFLHSETPYVYQWSLDLQYELARDLVVEMSYSGAKGTRLVNRVQDNQIRFEDAIAGRNLQKDRPLPYIAATNGVDTANGNNIYNAMNIRLEKRYNAGLNFLVNYTWSKNIESSGSGSSAWSQNGGTTYPLDSYNLWRERAVSPIDLPHVFTASSGYELPAGKGQRWLKSGVPAFLLGSWQVNGIASLRSGFPTDVRSSRVSGSNMMWANFNVPDVVSGVSPYLPNKGVDGWFNPAAFSEPQQVRATNGMPITMFGNAGRRLVRGPGSMNIDFSVFKNFLIRERLTVQFRAEAFNLTNTPTFNLPSATSTGLTTGNVNFGKLSSSSATGRQVQFAVKLYF